MSETTCDEQRLPRRIDTVRKPKRPPPASKGQMTQERLSVLRLLCQGLTHKEIARELSKAPSTVKHLMMRLRQMSGSKTLIQLGVWAVRQGHV